MTSWEDLALRCRMLANHGRTNKYHHQFEGANSRLDGLQAAILSVKLNHQEKWTERRRAAALRYASLLEGSGVVVPQVPPDVRHVYHLFVVRGKNREAVQREPGERGVATSIHYPIALPNLTAYKHLGHSPEDVPTVSAFAAEILSLPM